MRFTRDARGYEYTCLIHPVRREGRTENLLLYCFRTPPYVKVGRPALDPDVMGRLERQYPHIRFDWDKILREPPQALTEEAATRRKDQRDARDARRKRRRLAESREEFEAVPEEDGPSTEPDTIVAEGPSDEADALTEADVSTSDSPAERTAPLVASAHKRRRKRRRRRRREGEPGGNPPPNPSV